MLWGGGRGSESGWREDVQCGGGQGSSACAQEGASASLRSTVSW